MPRRDIGRVKVREPGAIKEHVIQATQTQTLSLSVIATDSALTFIFVPQSDCGVQGRIPLTKVVSAKVAANQ
jgi:hypothetical protein